MNQENISGAQMHRNLIMIWFALFSSQILFLVVIYVAKPELYRFDFRQPFLGDNAATVGLFGILAIVLFAGSFLMKKKFKDQAINEQKPVYLQTALIVGCAMCEAGSLFGVVLALSHSYPYFFAWIGLAMIGMAFHFPKRVDMINASFRKMSGN